MINPKGNNVFTVVCFFCEQQVMSSFTDNSPTGPLFRGFAECPECLKAIPEEIANAYIEAMTKVGNKRRSKGAKS